MSESTPKAGNAFLYNTREPFLNRVQAATQAWLEGGRSPQDLVDGDCFFALWCWAYDHQIKSSESIYHDPDIIAFAEACHEVNGGASGWNHLLNQRESCSRCYATYKLENMVLSTQRMSYLCPQCAYPKAEDYVG